MADEVKTQNAMDEARASDVRTAARRKVNNRYVVMFPAAEYSLLVEFANGSKRVRAEDAKKILRRRLPKNGR
jgi:hypothetical protein